MKSAVTAEEIRELLKQLEQTNSTETTTDQMAVAIQAIELVESNFTLKQRVISLLEAVETELFKELLDHPVANILVAAFKGCSKP